MVKNAAQTQQKTSSSQTDGLLGYGAVHASSSPSPPSPSPPSPDPDTSITYWRLLKTNRDYRIFIISFLITECGEWLTYMASIDVIETQMQKSNTASRTAISILVAARLIPNVLLSLFGGTLADSRDRRKSMMFLDICGAICCLFFVVAYHLQSIHLIYVTTFLQQSIAGLYQPCSGSIIPLMVPDDDKALQKAITLSELAWSAMSAFAASAGGFLVSAFGARNCFLIDSATYLASACLLGMMRGDYNVADTEKEYTSPWHQFKSMTVDGAQYLRSCFFGALVFVKFTGALIYGAADILNVVLSEQQQQPVPGEVTDPNQRLGLLFSVVGVGCLLGPLIAEPFMDMERPASLQLSCVVSFGIMAFGFYGWSMFTPFWSLCFFASIRAAGSSILWINSSILLQKFSEPQMLGRVMAVDVALAYSTEAASAYVCGVLLDTVGLTAPEVSFVFGSFGALCMLLWGWYHFSGGGATGYHQDELLTMQLNSTDYSLSKPLMVSTETSSLIKANTMIPER